MSGHTKGPWSVKDSAVCGAKIATNGKAVGIAHCWTSEAIDEATREANARLIAAAPHMLEALKLIAELNDAKIEHADKEVLFMLLLLKVDRARAAIAKAEGRET